MNKVYVNQKVIDDLRSIYNIDAIEEIKSIIEIENTEYEIIIEKDQNAS